MQMRSCSVAMLTCLLLFAVGCGYRNSACNDCFPPPPADNSGSWSGSIELPTLGSGGYTDMAMVQSGTKIHSTRLQISSLIGPPDCGDIGTMTGSITDSNITMTENTLPRFGNGLLSK